MAKAKTWYVILDEDGPFLSEDKPSETDEVLFQGTQSDAENFLQRECEAWENGLDDDEEMNEDFQ